jgi:hypothetical protein
MNAAPSPLYDQARHILRVNYGMTEETDRQLRQVVESVDDPAAAAVALYPQCTQGSVNPGDCLLLLEVLALEYQRMAGRNDG